MLVPLYSINFRDSRKHTQKVNVTYLDYCGEYLVPINKFNAMNFVMRIFTTMKRHQRIKNIIDNLLKLVRCTKKRRETRCRNFIYKNTSNSLAVNVFKYIKANGEQKWISSNKSMIDDDDLKYEKYDEMLNSTKYKSCKDLFG
jgi:hypothetical protein